MTINLKLIYFTIYLLVISKSTFKIFYLQYRFKDRCLLWICKGKIKDILWFNIN